MMTDAATAARYASRVGETAGRLTFLGLAPERGDGGRLLGRFACVCGRTVVRPVGRTLNAKQRLHCGCQTDLGASQRKHGMRNSPEYSSWVAMKSRCLNPECKDYAKYGAKGISIHPTWVVSFETFYNHVGRRPLGTSLDRIDNTKGYMPGNVRWATRKDQQRNRSTAFRWHIKGKIFETAQEAADHFAVSEHSVFRWVNGQFDPRRNTFTKPLEDCYVVARY